MSASSNKLPVFDFGCVGPFKRKKESDVSKKEAIAKISTTYLMPEYSVSGFVDHFLRCLRCDLVMVESPAIGGNLWRVTVVDAVFHNYADFYNDGHDNVAYKSEGLYSL